MIQKLNELGKQIYVDPYLIAGISVGLGETDRAFESLEKAYEVKSSFLISIKGDPKWDGLRSDPRFTEMMRRVGFPL